MPPAAPTLSVIVPAHLANAALLRCVESLQRLAPPPHEVILVDDGGEGAVAAVAAQRGFRSVTTAGRQGPAVGRNLGASVATGDVFVFFDADVAVPPDIIGQLTDRFAREGEVDAVIGSYDESPAAAGFFSQYKNLVHRYIHQRSSEIAFTFWGACGAVRRTAFEAVGGFDERYRRPSVEDIELGYRLRAAGFEIRLDPRIEVTHLKRWTLASLLRADIGDRAVPWTRLIVRSGHVPNDLNLSTSSRVAAALACLLAPTLVAAQVWPAFWWTLGAEIGALLAIDAPLWRFLHAKGGAIFAAKGMLWHWFYYVYGTVAFVTVAAITWVGDRLGGTPEAPVPVGRGPRKGEHGI